jgi:hypothetical protein
MELSFKCSRRRIKRKNAFLQGVIDLSCSRMAVVGILDILALPCGGTDVE